MTVETGEYYEALICGGPNGIGVRITGSEAREFSPGVLRRLHDVLDRGFSIQVISPDEATWIANRPVLMRQLGFEAGPPLDMP